MDQNDKFICKKYKVFPKTINEKTLYKILDILASYYDVQICEHNWDNAAYTYSIELPQLSEEEELCIGCGWTFKEALLNLLNQIEQTDGWDTEDVYCDIQNALRNAIERLIYEVKTWI